MLIQVRKQNGNFSLEASFSGAESGITALFGPSGSGKTSLINMIAGLVCPDAGRIEIGGRCLFDSSLKINLPPEKRRLGYVFQDGRLFPHLDVKDNLLYGLRLLPRKLRRTNFDEVLALLGIEALLKRKPGKLSGGEKQRVAIGRALLSSPQLLLMDEPLAALDEARKEELLPYIANINAQFKLPIIYVSHAMQEILSLTQNIIYLDQGRVVDQAA